MKVAERDEDRERAIEGEIVGEADGRRGQVQRRQQPPMAAQQAALHGEAEGKMDERDRGDRAQHQIQRLKPGRADHVGRGDQVQAPDGAGDEHRARARSVGPDQIDCEPEQGEQTADDQVAAETPQVVVDAEAHGGDDELDLLAAVG